jgi:hypothetical protein
LDRATNLLGDAAVDLAQVLSGRPRFEVERLAQSFAKARRELFRRHLRRLIRIESVRRNGVEHGVNVGHRLGSLLVPPVFERYLYFPRIPRKFDNLLMEKALQQSGCPPLGNEVAGISERGLRWEAVGVHQEADRGIAAFVEREAGYCLHHQLDRSK